MPYRTQSPDTHPEIERRLIEGYRRMSAAEKLRCLQQLVDTARALQTVGIRSRRPGITEEELRLRLASHSIPAELMRRVFGWDPDREGY
jgi:hypothetical protein